MAYERAEDATLRPWLIITVGVVAAVAAVILATWWRDLLWPPESVPPEGFIATGLPGRGEWHLLYETQPSQYGIWQIEPVAGVTCYAWSATTGSPARLRHALGCVREEAKR